ncbi:MAG: hypothetical protein CM15mP63_0730 [Gammaproteobacteria bacterium]|nr:MAG: hypothetical protein CM15mP63_0730 [Gammaproteobacteria bacterium]
MILIVVDMSKRALNKAISYGNNKQNNKQLGQKIYSHQIICDDIESLINLDNYQIIETREQRLQSLSNEKKGNRFAFKRTSDK